jgi:hypothetical protein
MNIISATSAVVHSVQTQTVTQSSFVRKPEEPYIPIRDEPSVPFGSGDNYLRPIGHVAYQTFGNYINATV